MRSILSGFPTEKVNLVKKDGNVFKYIEALVQPDIVFIEDTSVSIGEEDIIERTLPNGAKERFVVLDRGFQRGRQGIPDHYQIKVEKESNYKSKLSSSTSQIYNINNQTGKINIHSVDQSINYTLSEANEKMFLSLQDAAKDIDDGGQLEDLTQELRDNVGKETYALKYNKFIQSAANHMTIFAPFIPFLSQFLTNG